MVETMEELLSKISLEPNRIHETPPSSAGISRLDILIDGIIPRGGVAPKVVHVMLEEYLARVASLHRKLVGCRYRLEKWREIFDEHQSRFLGLAEARNTTALAY